jgi:hypothetical protein
MAVKKNKTKVWLVFAVTGLLVIVLSGTLLYLLRGGEGKAKTANPTTPTASTVTPTPTLTGTAQPQPLFFDDFVDSDKGWSLTSVSGYTRKIENGNLILADENHNILTESLPTSATFNDFMVTVTLTLIQANREDSVGLYMRGDSYLDHDYRLNIYGDNTYAISKEFLDQSREPQVNFLVKPTTTTALHPVGQQNIITVIMKGPKLVLIINGTVVNSVHDTDYISGQLALFVQNSEASRGVMATFSSVAVYPAPLMIGR